jgi:Tol biopolymer transport system component/predicted Ser/Thr protein kinase
MTPGTKLGPYEIVSPIGKGGMGEVWKARDPRLNRDVALKVSKAEFTERFKQEAQMVAQLNHRNICTLYDVGPNYLVMEFIDGVPLKGPLPVEKAVEYAGQILDALDAAHRKGITHRDLKPANILVTKQGIKLLDFGLAKQAAGLGPDDVTIQAMTAEGQISGTLQYMSPEQLQGKKADARSDIFSFGCVLYEMLSGSRAFGGTNAASIIAAIMEREPEPLKTTPPLDRVIRTCLAKDPDERFQTARDVKKALLWAADTVLSTAAPSQSRFGMAGWISAGVFALVAVALAFIHFRERPPDPQVLRYTIALPEKIAVDDFAISPDGRSVAIRGLSGNGSRQLWVRLLDSLQPRALPGTEGAGFPFWSPDSRYIGFFANGKLKKLAAAGGLPQTLCDADNGRGGAWGSEGVIVFSSGSQGELSRVSAAGGVPVPVIKADLGVGSGLLSYPVFLPDGRRFLYSNIAGTSPGIYLGSLDSATTRRIAPDLSKAQYMPPADGSRNGYLLFVREGTLTAQPVDPRTLDAAGDLFPIAEHVGVGRTLNALFSLSPSGILIYDAGGGTQWEISRPLSWLDREGKLLKTFGSPGIIDFALSPDEKKLALERRTSPEGFGSDLWVADLEHGTESRLTFNNGTTRAFNPVWSPDGSRIAFEYADRSKIVLRASNGTGQEQVLFESKERATPWDWSGDGKFLIFSNTAKGGGMDALPIVDEGKPGDRKPIPLVRGEFSFRHGQVSPDGRWLGARPSIH